MSSIERLIQREDGSEIKIVATEMFGLGLVRSVDVYVLRRPNAQSNWSVCSDRPHPDWRTMSVADYEKHGRSEMLRMVSPGEILSVTARLEALHQSSVCRAN